MMQYDKNTRIPFLICLFLVMMAQPVQARFVLPDYLPVERLAANTEAYIAEHPNEPQGYYTLGRIHYLAFISRIGLVGAYRSEELPWLVGQEFPFADAVLNDARRTEAQARVLQAWGLSDVTEVSPDKLPAYYDAVRAQQQALAQQGWQPDPLTITALVSHAESAIVHFERAMDLDPDNGLYYLGAASLYEQFSDFVHDANITDVPIPLAHTPIPRIRLTYYLAYRLAVEEDLTWEYVPLRGGTGLPPPGPRGALHCRRQCGELGAERYGGSGCPASAGDYAHCIYRTAPHIRFGLAAAGEDGLI